MIWALAIAFAQSPDPLATGTATPASAYDALEAGDKLTSRRLAAEVLAVAPNDFIANYVVAKVYWEEDANLPRALYHYKLADKRYVASGSEHPQAATVHCRVLQDLGWVAEDMENSSLFYATLNRYNASECDPKRYAQRGWRLMKDGRYDEAREVAETGLRSDNTWQVALGGNVLCALEALVRDRAAAVVACEAVIERSRASGYDLTVEAYNTSTTTLSNLDFKRTEELFDLATQGRAGGATNPWQYYVGFHLQRGRGTDALNAVQQMQQWRHAQEPAERAQNRAEADAALASLLLAAGATDDGMRVIDRALLHPDRRASTTATAGTTKAAHTVLRRAMRRVHRERQAETRSTAAFPVRVWGWLNSWLPDPTDGSDRWTVQGVLTTRKVFESTFIVYHDDGLPVPLWLVGDLIPLLGPGVVQVELDRQRSLEAHAGIFAYYDALEAEVAWHRGQHRTLELVERALNGLPREEVLLRARVAALGADYAWRSSDSTRAMALYERALQLDPGVLRRLGLALPASVVSAGGPIADDAAAMVRRSPRVDDSYGAFQVAVSDASICLSAPSGNQIGCVSAPSEPTDSPAASLVEAWHTEAFSLPLDLGRLDMRSLDSTTTLDQDARRRALDNLLEGY